ncbi:MAG: hypothetical protein JWM59_1876 [Verrucomicrobiales bacterium]|nr:hypothetical protein [Verrucomicrobiales bacterium]
MHIPAEVQKTRHRLLGQEPSALRFGGNLAQSSRHRSWYHIRHPLAEATRDLRTRFKAEGAKAGGGVVTVHGPVPYA